MTTPRKTYAELLRDPRWQRRRLERLQYADFNCERCSDSASTLHVHHRRYVKGRMPWEYEDNELLVLCENCHTELHHEREVLERVLLGIFEGFEGTGSTAALVAGYLTVMKGFVPNILRDEVADEALGLDPFAFLRGQIAAETMRVYKYDDLQELRDKISTLAGELATSTTNVKGEGNGRGEAPPG